MLKNLITFTVVLVSGFVFSQENTWERKADFSGLKREKAVAFSIGNLGYIGCGVDTAEITHNDLWQYDPELDTWTQVASMPGSERRHAVGFSIDDMGYIGTGFSLDDGDLGVKLNDFWAYNAALNSWDNIADYPGGGDTGIYQSTAFSALGKGYVACGKIGSDNYIPEMWQYDPLTDTWTERTPFPGGDRYQLISFVINDKAYMGMGTDHDVFRRDMYVYDPSSNTWEDAPDFPGSERAKASSFAIGNKGFVVFGTDGGLKDELWEFDAVTESWTPRAAFPGGGRSNGIAFSISDKGYVGLGKEVSGKKQSFYQYTPLGPLSSSDYQNIEVQCYPNPMVASSNVILPHNLNQGTYKLFNLTGALTNTVSFNNNNFTIQRDNLPVGMYLLVIFNKDGIKVGQQKIQITNL